MGHPFQFDQNSVRPIITGRKNYSLVNSELCNRLQYISFVELGNIFLDFEDWPERYRQLLDKAGDLLTERLLKVPSPYCLLCAEKNPEQCHRKLISDYLVQKDYPWKHIQ
ncbi:MAG: DUF488 family protein [Phycisphaerae bacterium]